MNLISELLRDVGERVSKELPWRISTRDLSRHTTRALAALHTGQRSAVVTYRGVPSFLILPIDQRKLAMLLLASTPDLVERSKAS
jgi:antitoxin (DNA-binding transcriptional repressor) of toxin-antitoxin stability system